MSDHVTIRHLKQATDVLVECHEATARATTNFRETLHQFCEYREIGHVARLRDKLMKVDELDVDDAIALARLFIKANIEPPRKE